MTVTIVDGRGDPVPARAERPAPGAALAVAGLEVVYGGAVRALRDVSLTVPAGEIVAVLGSNGAGKTTLARAVTGLLGFHRGEITHGEVLLDGRPLRGMDGAAIVRAGIAQVMEGRRVFAELSVADNLRAGAFTARGETAFDRALDLFGFLRERLGETAGNLSGGEQQMLAIARSLMARPRLLLLDEPSLGLAPRVVAQVREAIVEINRQGTSVVLIEQNARMALSIAGQGYVLDAGRVVLDGPAASLLENHDVQKLYLGVAAGRPALHDPSARRRRRWSI